jgi:hypothetical protein
MHCAFLLATYKPANTDLQSVFARPELMESNASILPENRIPNGPSKGRFAPLITARDKLNVLPGPIWPYFLVIKKAPSVFIF